MQEENQIVNAENYRSKDDGMNFKEIVMRQLQRVVVNTSQEMRKGFWIYSQPTPMQSSQRTRYIGDSRKELKASIDVPAFPPLASIEKSALLTRVM